MPVSDFKTAYTEVRNLAAQPSQDQQLDVSFCASPTTCRDPFVASLRSL